MTAAWHLGPMDQSSPHAPFDPSAWRHIDFFREQCKSHWGRLARFRERRHRWRSWIIMRRLIVNADRRWHRLAQPVDHDIGEQFIFSKAIVEITSVVTPGPELVDDPGCKTCGRIVESVTECERPATLDGAVRALIGQFLIAL